MCSHQNRLIEYTQYTVFNIRKENHTKLSQICRGFPLVAYLFLFCYESDFMLSPSDENQSEVIVALNSTSRYLDDLMNIDSYCQSYLPFRISVK